MDRNLRGRRTIRRLEVPPVRLSHRGGWQRSSRASCSRDSQMRSRAERIVDREWSSASASLSSELKKIRSERSNPLASVRTPPLQLLSRRAAQMAVVRTWFTSLVRPLLALSVGRIDSPPHQWHTCARST